MVSFHRRLMNLALSMSLFTTFLVEAKEEKPEKLRPHYNQHKLQALKATTDYFNSLFWTHYAPIKWKVFYFGWNPDQKAQSIKTQFEQLASLDLDPIKLLFNQFIESSRDGHVNAYYDDQRIAQIPLDVTWLDGKILITSSGLTGIEPGDEILKIDDLSVLDYLSQALYASTWEESPVARPLLNLERLFFRYGYLDALSSLNQPTIKLELKREDTCQIVYASWEFFNNPDNYLSRDIEKTASDSKKTSRLTSGLSIKPAKHSAERYIALNRAKKWITAKKALSSLKKQDDDFYNDDVVDLSEEEINELIQEMLQQLHAQKSEWSIREIENKKIGYFPLPDFADEMHLEHLDQAIESLMEGSDALIIDLRGNSGGYDLICFAILSRLIDQPLLNTVESYMLNESQVCDARQQRDFYQSVLDHNDTDEEIHEFLGMKNDLGYSVDREYIKGQLFFSESIVHEWESGFTCTRFIPSSGVSYIKPYSGKRYTKPLFILIDETCGSNGDAFPAILKDNGRAQLIGRTTAGLGGSIDSYTLPNFMGIESITLTRSLVLRNNQLVIEDLGVIPDVEYKRTLETVLNPELELADTFQYVAEVLSNPNQL